jgi:D-xylose transport system substrate-binding protein
VVCTSAIRQAVQAEGERPAECGRWGFTSVSRFWGSVLLLCLPVGLAGSCAEPGRPRIGVIVSNMRDPVYVTMRAAMTDRMAADGVDLLWVSSSNSEAKQRQDLEAMASLDVDVLIFQPVSTTGFSGLVRDVVQKGIPVVALDRLPADSPVSLYVTADSRTVGRLQARLLAEKLGGNGNVLILEGEEGHSVAAAITQGNLEVLTQHEGLRVVLRRPHRRWDRALARLTVEEALDLYGRLDGILANNSAMAMGALEVLRQRGLNGRVQVVGADADYDACLAVLDGDLLGEVDKRPYELGLAAYEAALDLHRGYLRPGDEIIQTGAYQVPVRLVPVRLITRENVQVEMSYRWGALALAD